MIWPLLGLLGLFAVALRWHNRPQRAQAVAVVVTAAELTVVAALLLSTCSVEPEGLENCRPLEPSAAFNCATADVMPAEKLMPICFGLALGAFCNGSAVGSVTFTI